METTPIKLNRAEKMLLFIYEHGKAKKVRIRYEEIVVGLFKKYPEDFHLKGYPEYPDSGDGMHQPLYLFKKNGYITGMNKIFTLTDSGLDFARKIKEKTIGLPIDTTNRVSRNTSIEVSRVSLQEGFSLFVAGNKENVSENDFYIYLGITARTSRSLFSGRLETMRFVIEELKNEKGNDLYGNIIKYNEFLFTKYQAVITYFLGK